MDGTPTHAYKINSNTDIPPDQKSILASPKSQAQIPIVQEEKVMEGGGANVTSRFVDLSMRSSQSSSASSTGKVTSLAPALIDKVTTIHRYLELRISLSYRLSVYS